MSLHSLASSISSSSSVDLLDDIIRSSSIGNGDEDVEVSLASASKPAPPAPHTATTTAHNNNNNNTKTPKTPSMDALTKKYEFLLHDNDDDDNETTRTANKSCASSRSNSRSNTPTRFALGSSSSASGIVKPKLSLSASSIMHRLQSSEEKIPRHPTTTTTKAKSSPFASPPSWDNHASHNNNSNTNFPTTTSASITSSLKQNLEHRLKQLVDDSSIHASSDRRRPQPQHHTTNTKNTNSPVKKTPVKTPPPAVRFPSQRTRRPTPFLKAFLSSTAGVDNDNNDDEDDDDDDMEQQQQDATPHIKPPTQKQTQPPHSSLLAFSSTKDNVPSSPSSLISSDPYRMLVTAGSTTTTSTTTAAMSEATTLGILPERPPPTTTTTTTCLVPDAESRDDKHGVNNEEGKPQQNLRRLQHLKNRTPLKKNESALVVVGMDKNRDHKRGNQHYYDSKSLSSPAAAAAAMTPTNKTATPTTTTTTTKKQHEDDSASFWHRWKMAEQRMQQQQDQFEQEKVEWIRQLESAYNANAQVEALAKRMEVQLLAVHKTCLQQDDDDDDDDDFDYDDNYNNDNNDNDMLRAPKEAPLDPLHLLMLKEDGALPKGIDTVEQFAKMESDEWDDTNRDNNNNNNNIDAPPTNNNKSTMMDSFEYTDRLERRMARTRTKNVILSHLVKLLERQADEQKRDLQQQLKSEREEREELWREFRNLEFQLEQKEQQQQQQQQQDPAGVTFDSNNNNKGRLAPPMTPPTEGGQHKALQHRLWLREQQYEQERKEFAAKLQALEEECDHYKQLADQKQHPAQREHYIVSSPKPSKDGVSQKQVADLQSKLQSVIDDKETTQRRCQELQTSFDQLQKQVADTEHAQTLTDLRHKQELSRLQSQLKLQKQQAEEQTKALEAQLEQMENKHDRDRKEWEWILSQSSSSQSGAVIGVGSVTTNIIERMEKQRDMERTRWEAKLNAAQEEATRYKERESNALVNIERLEAELEAMRLEIEFGHESTTATTTSSRNVSELQELHKQQVDELVQQIDEARTECQEKKRQVADLQTWLDESNAEVRRLQKHNSNPGAADDTQQLEEEITHLEFSLQVERENVEQAQRENERLEAVIEQLTTNHEREIRDLEARMQEVVETGQTQNSDSTASQGIMAEKYVDLDNQLQEKVKELDQCLASLQAESAKCKQVLEKNASLELELQQLSKQHTEEKSEWEIIVDSLEAEKEAGVGVNTQLAYLSKKNEELESELERIKSEFNADMESLRTEESKARQIEERNLELEERNSELDIKVVNLTKQNAMLSNELLDFEKRNSGLNEELNDLSSRFAAEKEDLANQCKHLSGALTDVQNKLQDKDSSLEAHSTQLELAQSKCQQLEQGHLALNREFEQLNDRFIAEMKEWEVRYQSLRTESVSTHDELQERNVSLEQQVKEQHDMIETLREEKGEAHKQVEARNSHLEQKVQQLEDQLQSIKSENDEARNKLLEDKTVLEQQVEQVMGELETRSSSYRQLEEKNFVLNMELEQLNERFIAEMKDMEARYQEMRWNSEKESNGSMRELLEKTSRLEEEVRKFQHEVETQNAVLDKERQTHQSLLDELESLKQQLNDSTADKCTESSSAPLDAGKNDSVTPLKCESVKFDAASDMDVKIQSGASSSQCDQLLQTERDCEELQTKNALLEARMLELQVDLDAANSALENAVETNRKLESQVEEVKQTFAKEKDEWESQIRDLATCESNDSVRTQELIEQKAERERQLEEAKKELEIGLKALRDESEKYRCVVDRNFSLVEENKQLHLEKARWEANLRLEKEKNKREQETLLQEVQELRNVHEKTLKDWCIASEQTSKENDLIQRQLDELVAENHSLTAKLAAAEREIETILKHHETNKIEWKEHADLTSQQAAESSRNAVDELRREVLKMGEQIVMSNEAIKELSTKRNGQDDVILSSLDRIHRDLEDAASKIELESLSISESREMVLRRLDELEKNTVDSSGQSVASLDQHRALLEHIMDMCVRSEAAATTSMNNADELSIRRLMKQEVQQEIEQYKTDLATVRDELLKTLNDLDEEKNKRAEAESRALLLQDQLSHYNDEPIKPKMLFEEQNIEHADFDKQLAELGEQIESEMEQIRRIADQESQTIVSTVEESDELLGARQAMFAQTLLLVQSLRDITVNENNDADEEEELSGVVFQHLEILSELIGEVELMESSEAAQLRNKDENVEAVLVPGRETESDLLRFELEQDDSMLDLLNDGSPTHNLSRSGTSVLDSLAIAGINLAAEPYCPGSGKGPCLGRAASPIELVVEQTYQKCQLLERERCDLINVTLDLLSASREANKAELEAALATARRKASEEMIAMKKQTQAHVDQIWCRLCEKCRQGLTQG